MTEQTVRIRVDHVDTTKPYGVLIGGAHPETLNRYENLMLIPPGFLDGNIEIGEVLELTFNSREVSEPLKSVIRIRD